MKPRTYILEQRTKASEGYRDRRSRYRYIPMHAHVCTCVCLQISGGCTTRYVVCVWNVSGAYFAWVLLARGTHDVWINAVTASYALLLLLLFLGSSSLHFALANRLAWNTSAPEDARTDSWNCKMPPLSFFCSLSFFQVVARCSNGLTF